MTIIKKQLSKYGMYSPMLGDLRFQLIIEGNKREVENKSVKPEWNAMFVASISCLTMQPLFFRLCIF